MVCHDVEAVDDKVVRGAVVGVVVVDALEVSVLFSVGLEKELAVVTAPDFVKSEIGKEEVFSWNSHTMVERSINGAKRMKIRNY
jgi:hypothetical protein